MIVHVCRTEMEEVFRKPDGERWCFACRARRAFLYVVQAPVDPWSWYGPTPHVECGTCRTIDADLFPGTERVWTDA